MKVMRLSGLMRKEVYEILRDPSSIAIAFVLPLVLLLIFGYGVSLDARHISWQKSSIIQPSSQLLSWQNYNALRGFVRRYIPIKHLLSRRCCMDVPMPSYGCGAISRVCRTALEVPPSISP